MKVKVLVTQLCLTLYNPKDCSPPGFSVDGILLARILEWVAIPFSRDLPEPGIDSRLSELWGKTYIYVCVCIHTHTHTHTHRRAVIADDYDILVYWYGRKYSISGIYNHLLRTWLESLTLIFVHSFLYLALIVEILCLTFWNDPNIPIFHQARGDLN